MNSCYICGAKPRENIDTCEYCQSLINNLKNRDGAKNVRKALKNAEPMRDKKGEVWFKCYYTKIYGKFNMKSKVGLNPLDDACVLSMDHKIPGNPSSLVVSLLIINSMKQNIPEEKFRSIVIKLGIYFENNKQNEFEEKFKIIVNCSK